LKFATYFSAHFNKILTDFLALLYILMFMGFLYTLSSLASVLLLDTLSTEISKSDYLIKMVAGLKLKVATTHTLGLVHPRELMRCGRSSVCRTVGDRLGVVMYK
jgi:hypothetical protein